MKIQCPYCKGAVEWSGQEGMVICQRLGKNLEVLGCQEQFGVLKRGDGSVMILDLCAENRQLSSRKWKEASDEI